MTEIVFRPLQPGDADELDRAQRIMAAEDYAFAFNYTPGQDFASYLELLEAKQRGQRLSEGGVASTFEVGLVGGRIVARLSVRHALNDFLREQGGHIGYAVLPEFRRRGFGLAALRRGLQVAASLGIAATLVTCDEDNAESCRIVEKAGGRFESSYFGPDTTVPVRRYWFDSETPPNS